MIDICRSMIREMCLCVHIHIHFYICIPTHLKDMQVFVLWKQTKNQPLNFHKKETDINRKQKCGIFLWVRKNCFVSQQLYILVIFIISWSSCSFDDHYRWAKEGWPQTAMVLSTTAFLKMCQD